MLGDRIHAEEAVRWGMIWRSVPDAELLDEAMAVAARLSKSPPGVCREVRHAYEAAQTQDLASQMEYERLHQRVLLDTPSFGEGVRAFELKRDPDFYRGTE